MSHILSIVVFDKFFDISMSNALQSCICKKQNKFFLFAAIVTKTKVVFILAIME